MIRYIERNKKHSKQSTNLWDVDTIKVHYDRKTNGSSRTYGERRIIDYRTYDCRMEHIPYSNTAPVFHLTIDVWPR